MNRQSAYSSMKIALLVKRFTRSGGKERYVVELALTLKRLGHDIHIFSYTCDHDLLNRFKFHKVCPGTNVSSVLNTLSFIRTTNRMIDPRDFDIVHSHERNYTQPIVTLHSLSYQQGLEKYSSIRRLDQKYLSMRSLIYLWLENRQMKSPWLVAVSQEVCRDVKKYYGRFENIRVISPGVAIDKFNPDLAQNLREKTRKKLGLDPLELAVLFIGSDFERKGLDRILPFIQEGMRLYVVGKGDKLAKFKGLIRRLGVEKKVVITGMVKDVINYYSIADVVVLPSRSEAFGMSILEGMACGLPVIVTANCGVTDLIEHGKNGLIVKNDIELGAFLDLLKSDEKKRCFLGKNARETAKAYTWERIGQKHIELYSQILSNK